MKWEQAKSLPLGHPWTREDLTDHFQCLAGGVAWPAGEPGLAVVVGVSYVKRPCGYDLYVLDEAESDETQDLVKKWGVLADRYRSATWYGQPVQGKAAEPFIQAYNQKLPDRCPHLYLRSDETLTNMEQPYNYMVPTLLRLIEEERRLFHKESRARQYVLATEKNKLREYEFGDFPAIEALAFAVYELQDYAPSPRQHIPDKADYDPKEYLMGGHNPLDSI